MVTQRVIVEKVTDINVRFTEGVLCVRRARAFRAVHVRHVDLQRDFSENTSNNTNTPE